MNKLKFVNDPREFSGQLGGTLGSIKDHFKILLLVFKDVFKYCLGQSLIDLGAIWDHPGQLLENMHSRKHNPPAN